jgi:hypothetical protein
LVETEVEELNRIHVSFDFKYKTQKLLQSKVPWMVIITLTTINTFADEFVGGENGLVAKIREYNYITVFKQFLCFIIVLAR